MLTVFGLSSGGVTIRVISALPEKLLSLIIEEGISLRNVRLVNDISFTANIKREDMHMISRLVDKEGGMLEIIGKHGVYWDILSFAKRPVFVFSLFLFLILSIYLPTRVLFVEISGNHAISNERILEIVRGNGIHFGASREKVRSEKIKNAILEEIADLQWVGVNTRGCVAYVSVKEKSTITENEPGEICSISASFDGTITEMTVTRGNPVVKVGDQVKEGDILVSGYTDCGISIKAESAEAEIYADTIRNITAVSPTKYNTATERITTSKKYSVLIGKKLINFFKGSGISGVGCVRMYKRYVLTLPGGFRLPLELICLTEERSETALSETADTECYEWVQNYAREQLCNTMLAGRICSEELSQTLYDGFYVLEGEYCCSEMIGQICNEEFTRDYGERD